MIYWAPKGSVSSPFLTLHHRLSQRLGLATLWQPLFLVVIPCHWHSLQLRLHNHQYRCGLSSGIPTQSHDAKLQLLSTTPSTIGSTQKLMLHLRFIASLMPLPLTKSAKSHIISVTPFNPAALHQWEEESGILISLQIPFLWVMVLQGGSYQ